MNSITWSTLTYKLTVLNTYIELQLDLITNARFNSEYKALHGHYFFSEQLQT